MHERSHAQETNNMRAVFIAFVYLTQRLVERNAIVPLSSDRHRDLRRRLLIEQPRVLTQ